MKGDYVSGSPAGLENVSRKDVDNALRQVDELAKRWHNRITFENLAWSKRYMEGEVSACVVFRLVKDPTRKFVAIFQRERRLRPSFSDSWAGRPGTHEGDTHQISPDWDNCSVFVYDVQAIEPKQPIMLASFVSFQAADNFFGFGPDSSEKLSGLGVVKNLRTPTYWEVGFTHHRLGNFLDAFKMDETGGEGVEGGHQIMSYIPNNCAEFGWDRLDDSNAVDYNSGFRLVIDDSAVGIATTEKFDHALKVSKVFFGPIELNSAT